MQAWQRGKATGALGLALALVLPVCSSCTGVLKVKDVGTPSGMVEIVARRNANADGFEAGELFRGTCGASTFRVGAGPGVFLVLLPGVRPEPVGDSGVWTWQESGDPGVTGMRREVLAAQLVGNLPEVLVVMSRRGVVEEMGAIRGLSEGLLAGMPVVVVMRDGRGVEMRLRLTERGRAALRAAVGGVG